MLDMTSDTHAGLLTGLSMGKIVRLMRTARAAQVLRVARFRTTIGFIDDVILSENMGSMAGIGGLLFAQAAMTHVLACLWYAIGQWEMLNGYPSWVARLNDVDQAAGRERSTAYLYTTASHWALTQFTPGSMEVTPRSALERAFTIITLFFGLVMFSSMVSQITSAMASLRARHFERNRRLNMVKRYLREQRVSSGLVRKIIGYLRSFGYASDRKHLTEREVHALQELPEGMLRALRYETTFPMLAFHPLFRDLARFDRDAVAQICNSATDEIVLKTEETLFRFGQAARAMYFVVSGSLSYTLGQSTEGVQTVQRRDMVSEAVLWLTWRHQGALTAIVPSTLIALDAEKFRDALATLFATHSFKHMVAPEGDQDVEELSDLIKDNEVIKIMVKQSFPYDMENLR
eukprot:CAMPEP_0170635630 /NCGR_PEP_ID=MMETSP0224-20130122/37326_1 /TAXON_ID=285029 /ORGANISM="Togula jolla, Strain CCCM 725" /LENGTH=403 /DNA_ID=CAMNT_0010965147 /DNA_START=1 /DNA_END=1209 /DNA_ORIENTATION=+